MTADRKYRTPDEITADLLVGRLDPKQLAELVGNPRFSKYQGKILEKLQVIDGFFSPQDFEKAHHRFRGCDVAEVSTGKTSYLHGVDVEVGSWSERVPVKHLECQVHKVSSADYIYWGDHGDIRRTDLVFID